VKTVRNGLQYHLVICSENVFRKVKDLSNQIFDFELIYYLQDPSEESWDIVNIAEGEQLPSVDYVMKTYMGIVITGSHFNVRDGSSFIR